MFISWFVEPLPSLRLLVFDPTPMNFRFRWLYSPLLLMVLLGVGNLMLFFLRRFGRSGLYSLLATPFPVGRKAVSYNLVANETTGKLFLEDKHFSLSINKELDLIFRSCSKRALFIRRSWWELSASFNFLLRRSTDSEICPTSSTSLWNGGSLQSSTSGRWVLASNWCSQ
jgi:hypothetical protein